MPPPRSACAWEGWRHPCQGGAPVRFPLGWSRLHDATVKRHECLPRRRGFFAHQRRALEVAGRLDPVIIRHQHALTFFDTGEADHAAFGTTVFKDGMSGLSPMRIRLHCTAPMSRHSSTDERVFMVLSLYGKMDRNGCLACSYLDQFDAAVARAANLVGIVGHRFRGALAHRAQARLFDA